MGADGWLGAPFEIDGRTIWVAGHMGLVGSALVRRLHSEDCKLLTTPRAVLDLRDQAAVYRFCESQRPDVVIIAAAMVGGIADNIKRPADFIHDNLLIQLNVMEGARRAGVQKLLFLGSSCMYPKDAQNPIRETALMEGKPEETNAAYAIAKQAGFMMAQSYRRQHGCDYITAIPCNLYGPQDRFDALRGHVIPALIKKARAAMICGDKTLEIWGSGKPRREFLHADDLADALIFMLKNYSCDRPLNIGAGTDITIAELAAMIKKISEFSGDLVFNPEQPDGVSCKLMDSSRIFAAGWKPSVILEDGLRRTYEWYSAHESQEAT